ncbi:MAG: GGDEF domain-containing protein [Clostridiales bacterium]|nr:GGDEF domain-containing protein [Clostridiales bacterium]
MRKYSILSIRKVAAVSLAFYILTYYVLIVLFSGRYIAFLLSDFMGMFGEVVSILIICLGLRWQKTWHKAEWKIFALGVMMIFIGDFIWSIYEMPLKQEVPFPSVCDIFYLCGSVCFIFALIFYIRREKLFDIVRTGFDILITMVVSGTIIFKYILLPIWSDGTITFLQKSISLAYPIFDLGFLGGIFSLFFFCASKSKLNRSNLLISTAFLIMFFADQMFAILSNFTYVSGGFLDPLWPIGCWVLSLGSLYPPFREISDDRKKIIEKSKKQRLLIEYLGFLFPYISVIIIVILLSYKYISKDPLVTGTVITVLLIMVRQIFSLLENKRLIRLIETSNQMLEESNADLEEQNTKLQELNYIKEYEANTDFLTGIFNRRYIDEILQSSLKEKANNEKMEISILLIDIDHFKQINDQWGHKVGDSVLKQIAFLIKNSIRSVDIAGRFGGDEFIIILPNTDLRHAKYIADRLRKKAFQTEFMEYDIDLKVTLSIGCTQWKGVPNEYDIKAMIAAADKALYRAKESGRNQCKAEVL